jgi:hypothetical protein
VNKIHHKHLSASVGYLYIVDRNEIIRSHFLTAQQNIRAEPLFHTPRNRAADYLENTALIMCHF